MFDSAAAAAVGDIGPQLLGPLLPHAAAAAAAQGLSPFPHCMGEQPY
jgi:hypothetical protein